MLPGRLQRHHPMHRYGREDKPSWGTVRRWLAIGGKRSAQPGTGEGLRAGDGSLLQVKNRGILSHSAKGECPPLADFCLSQPAAMRSSQPIMVTKRAGQIRCNRWSDRMQTPGQVQCKRVVSTDAIRWSSGRMFRRHRGRCPLG